MNYYDSDLEAEALKLLCSVLFFYQYGILEICTTILQLMSTT